MMNVKHKKVFKTWFMISVFLILFSSAGYGENSKLGLSHPLEGIPAEASFYFYFPDFQKAKSLIGKSKEFKTFLETKMIDDLQSYWIKKAENLSIFFTFTPDDLFSMIPKELLVGSRKDSKGIERYFIISSINTQAKALKTFLDTVSKIKLKDSSYQDTTYQVYQVYQGGRKEFYLLVLDQYLIFAENEFLMKEMILSVKNSKSLIGSVVTKMEIAAVQKMTPGSLYAKFKNLEKVNFYQVFPLVKDLAFYWDIDSKNLEIIATPVAEIKSANKKTDYEQLKLFEPKTALYYSNQDFNLKNLFDSLMKNQNTKNAADVFYQEKGWRLEELVKKMDEQIHIVFSGFVIPEGGHGYEIFQPEMSFVLKKKNSQDLETNEKIKQIASFYFSDFGWEEKQDMQNKLVYLTEKQSGFTLVFYKEWVVFATSLVQGESVISQIQKKKASLYDVFHRYIEGNPEGFLAVNPQKLLVQFENVLKEYALYKLLMDEAEYKENFGKLIDVFKDWKPFFLQYNYDKTDKKYHGKIQFLK